MKDLSARHIVDQPVIWPTSKRHNIVDAKVFRFVTDTISAPDGQQLKRSYLQHPGAVVVIALDEDDRIVVVRQYRHPVSMKLIEPPAGLLDVHGEDYVVAAQRELAEEAHLAAADWRILVDFCPSPGSTQESSRIYLARDLSPIETLGDYVADAEEADMDICRVRLADVLQAIFAGQVHNANLIIGVLALNAALHSTGLDSLRPAASPWPIRTYKEALDHALD